MESKRWNIRKSYITNELQNIIKVYSINAAPAVNVDDTGLKM